MCGALNDRKGKYEDVLDPFTLQDGWFEIDFDSLKLRPGPHLTATEAEKVDKTINRLKLNGWTCIEGRKHWLVPYLRGRCDMEHLEENALFLARELKRQELDNVNLPRWEEYRKSRDIISTTDDFLS